MSETNHTLDLSTKITNDLTIQNPVMMASGTFGHGAEYASLFDLGQLGGVVTKTITFHSRAGNAPPRTAETPSGMLNSIGLTNPGIDGFISEKVPPLAALNTCRVVSIAGTSDEEFAEMARRFNDLEGVDALELNISSPNMKDGGMLFGCVEKSAHDVTKAVKAVSKLPIIVKLTPNVTDITAIAKAVEDGGADGIALINTLLGMAVDVNTRRPILGNITGGLSGPAIKPVALALTWKVVDTVSIPVIGMGGITTARDALEFLIIGASAVQVGTATFVHPGAALEVIDGIADYCKTNGMANLSELIGSLQSPQSH
ncbi:MAG: dihydroorotate dehydrogenase [Candidatus Latescibacteria bacterium]|jgi:dihydroorotate dehydrogenase (NAD+) catalytic subunit|nr:dihydroorotate dehydrogenase [Candidatus Latescibacterota bacterium]MBT4139516.1 dihydroorotate dehydrogenase [Candidatus Latescibacterota bacterium]MBT5828829.1 dihydroorotate dehydrogenase [Candidatus Latescibacterota bacterium]